MYTLKSLKTTELTMKKFAGLFVALALASIGARASEPVTKTNPMVFGNNRLTIVTPTLLRLEYAEDSKFVDEPTLFAYDRTSLVDTADITVTPVADGWLEITTPALRIKYKPDGFPFSTYNLNVYYTLRGK